MTSDLASRIAAAWLVAAPAAATAATYHVSPAGDDAAAGSAAAPWQTLQHAADRVQPGDTVRVGAGQYAGFDLRESGTADAPIRFVAEPGAVIETANDRTPDGINLEALSDVVIEGFSIAGGERAGIRAVDCARVTVRDVSAATSARWDLVTDGCSDLRLEDNAIARSAVGAAEDDTSGGGEQRSEGGGKCNAVPGAPDAAPSMVWAMAALLAALWWVHARRRLGFAARRRRARQAREERRRRQRRRR
jgi:hypothetical protein